MRRCKSVMSIASGMVGSLVIAVGAAFGQSAPPRVEVGGQLNVLRLSDSSDTNVGLGGRVTFDLARWVSVEGEYQFIPSDELEFTSVTQSGDARRGCSA